MQISRRALLAGADPAVIQDALYDAEEHLRALQRKGVLALMAGSARGIVLKDALREQFGLPLIGRVAAGRPILAEEHIEGRFQIDPALFSPRPHYLLRVSGMSMRDVGILDGDLVAVHRSPDVRNRQIIVARLENEVTVKRYRQEGTVVWLMPENPEFEPIRVDLRKQSLTIEGVVVGVLRRGRPDWNLHYGRRIYSWVPAPLPVRAPTRSARLAAHTADDQPVRSPPRR